MFSLYWPNRAIAENGFFIQRTGNGEIGSPAILPSVSHGENYDSLILRFMLCLIPELCNRKSCAGIFSHYIITSFGGKKPRHDPSIHRPCL